MHKFRLISFKLCPFVQRSVIVLKEKKIPFEIEYIDLANKPDWFLKISPTGKVPVLEVDGKVLFESAVIMEYLDEVNPPSLHPTDAFKKAQDRAWIEFSSNLLVLQYQLSHTKSAEDYAARLIALRAGLIGAVLGTRVDQEEAVRLVEEVEFERTARAETFALAEQASAEAAQARRLAASREREAALAREEAELANSLVAEALAADAPLPPSRSVGPATVYTLAGTAFASGRATLTTEANASLRRLAMGIGDRSVEIVGFTDSQGAAAANLALSKRRAEAVAAILRESGAGGSLRTDGRGAADPVADNASAEGRAKNRRVEITVR